MKSLPHNRRAAFTLIEILVVIAVIGMLTALGCLTFRIGLTRSREKETMNFLVGISKSIEDYRQENGTYPRPADEGFSVTINGEAYPAGSAKMLYQVLSGDGTDAIKGGNKLSSGLQGSAQDPNDPGSGRVYLDSVVAPTKQETKDRKPVKRVESSGECNFYLIDSWRHPIQYQVSEVDGNGIPIHSGRMHGSAGFEIWSFGKLKKPQDSDEARKDWITNWKSP